VLGVGVGVGVALGLGEDDVVGVGDGVGVVVLLVVIVSLTERWFPDVSVARAVIVWLPSARPVVLYEKLQLLVPVAAEKALVSTATSTRCSATLSEAPPEIVTAPDTVVPPAGFAIVRLGAAVSAVEHVFVRLHAPPPFAARA